jgi:GNAT superfamily N-acetyltransferase
VAAGERERLAQLVAETWGSPMIVSREVLHDIRELSCLLAVDPSDGRWLGIAGYRFEGSECELVLLEAFERYRGIGGKLLAAVAELARHSNSRRLWLVTTNANVDAIRFYQRRGMRLARVWVDAVTRARQHLKPEIPMVGDYGISITDELEFEITFEPRGGE